MEVLVRDEAPDARSARLDEPFVEAGDLRHRRAIRERRLSFVSMVIFGRRAR
jgi:hypothetical protein